MNKEAWKKKKQLKYHFSGNVSYREQKISVLLKNVV